MTQKHMPRMHGRLFSNSIWRIHFSGGCGSSPGSWKKAARARARKKRAAGRGFEGAPHVAQTRARPNPLQEGRLKRQFFRLAAVDSCAGSALVLTALRVCWALAGAGWDENCCCCYLWQLRSSKLGLAAVLVYSCLSRRVCASFDCTQTVWH